jgi:enterochelin esterase-like enzyme
VLEPQSTALFLLLMAAFVGLVWWMVTARQVVFRVLAACLAFVPAMLFGVAAVNKYYDYYQSWGAVANDFTGQVANQSPLLPTLNNSSQKFAKTLGSLVNLSQARQEGYTVRVTVTGQQSHLRRTVLVYLPPQYFQAQYATYRFPVLELFPGFPGEPQDWINVLGVTTSLDTLVRDGLARPVVLVMPDTNGDRQRMMQCLNIPRGPQDATFLAVDVPTYIAKEIRVRPPGQAWATIGYSEGGYCAANLALLYRQTYGDAGVMSGYFSPLDNLLGKPPRYVSPFAGYPQLRKQNTPMEELPLLPAGTSVPRFWLGVGSGDTQDISAARAFQQLLLRRQPGVQLILAPGGGHTMFTWRALVPSLLEWVTPRVTDAS